MNIHKLLQGRGVCGVWVGAWRVFYDIPLQDQESNRMLQIILLFCNDYEDA